MEGRGGHDCYSKWQELRSAIASCDTYALLVASITGQSSITRQSQPDHEPIVKCSADTKMTQAGVDQ